jgi:hypothetical protein
MTSCCLWVRGITERTLLISRCNVTQDLGSNILIHDPRDLFNFSRNRGATICTSHKHRIEENNCFYIIRMIASTASRCSRLRHTRLNSSEFSHGLHRKAYIAMWPSGDASNETQMTYEICKYVRTKNEICVVIVNFFFVEYKTLH